MKDEQGTVLERGVPDELPARPDGWSRRLEIHYNYGDAGGAAIHAIHDADGTRMPINWQYDTRATSKFEGYVVLGGDEFVTWAALVEAWPRLRDRLAARWK